MKLLGRRLWLVLGGIIVVVVIAAGVLYTSNSRQIAKRNQLQSDILQAQLILDRANEEIKLLKSQTPQLTDTQLNEAKAYLASISFLSSSESIEYDTMLFSIADICKLHVANLVASAPGELEENNIKYQVTTFTINVEGVLPGVLFKAGTESKQYIDTNVNRILAFVSSIVTSNDFKTAIITSVSINAPEPLTDVLVAEMYINLQNEIKDNLTADEKRNKTAFEIEQLVVDKITAMTPDEINLFLDKQGLERPSATILFVIWTYKGE